MIVLNLKTYQQSLEKCLYFVDLVSEVVEDTGMRVIICPPSLYLRESSERFSGIFAQHVDVDPAGAHTGELPVEALKIGGVKGSLINHSEKKLTLPVVKQTIERLHSHTLESLACASTVEEVGAIADFSPTYIAIEPPELIGKGISVSSAKPEIITNSVKKIQSINRKVILLCGAGISSKEDVKKALLLGSKGVLLASAFVSAKDPKKFLQELVSVF